VYVGFFNNFLLLASFLGIGIGILLGRRPVAIGALIVFGDAAARFAADAGLALEGLERLPLDLWLPQDCPLRAAGVTLESIAAG
jgi:hypothetical protein